MRPSGGQRPWLLRGEQGGDLPQLGAYLCDGGHNGFRGGTAGYYRGFLGRDLVRSRPGGNGRRTGAALGGFQRMARAGDGVPLPMDRGA